MVPWPFEPMGKPKTNPQASHAAKALLGALARRTRWRGSLPATPAQRAEARGLEGAVNLVLTGERPSEWHFRLRDGALGVYGGLAPDARATLRLDDATFQNLLAGRLDPMTAQLTGKIRLQGDGEMGFLLSALIEQFQEARTAPGWRGWPRRRFARYVLRDVLRHSQSREGRPSRDGNREEA